MGNEPRRFFVIGFPRSRTAWLSVLLDGDGVRCEHEASKGRGAEGVEEYFTGRNDAVIGTCDSGILPHVPELVEKYPGAKWAVIHRPSPEALASVMADRPHEALQWQEKWPKLEAAFKAAIAALPIGNTLDFRMGDIDDLAGELYAHCTGRELDSGKHAALKGLRITQIAPQPDPIPERVRVSTVERVQSLGFDTTGLMVRPFDMARDALTFAEWASREHGVGASLIPLIPPLGVVVQDINGPKAMLFCRESYGVPAADLEFALTRPGMAMKEASAAMAFAAAACIELAGQLVVPPARYSVFRVTCAPAMGRFMKRIGFEPHGADNCQKYLYQKQ